ncbi:MAG: class I SAM-dependent methyltransferase [Candidatus Electrothrix sp. AUS4]|nr:class I SAM-dependent methyltransferase [Candidatus Electrothrix sp. AUS4]
MKNRVNDKELWDGIAEQYQKTVDNYLLLEPFIIDICGEVSNLNILEVGCGDGFISRKLSEKNATVTGIDIAPNMLKYSDQFKDDSLHLSYKVADATNLHEFNDESFELIVSNLVYMIMEGSENVSKSFQEAWRVLKQNGRFIFSIAHPCFDKREIEGNKTVRSKGNTYHQVDDKYEVSLLKDGVVTSEFFYYHRPLQFYSSILHKAGFLVLKLHEPTPSQHLVDQNPELKYSLEFPAFLIFEVIKTSQLPSCDSTKETP